MVASVKMQPVVAHVRNGRLLLDEPTDLPEGERVVLRPVDELVVVGDDDLDPEERAQLIRNLEVSIDQVERGCTKNFADVLARLRRRT
jgi:hypothetical protein